MHVVHILLFLFFVQGITSYPIRFEAEKSHATNQAKFSNDLPGYSHTGFINYLDASDATLFTINIPSDDEFLLTLRYSSESEVNFSIIVNGYVLSTLLLTSSKSQWANTKLVSPFRSGINTLVIRRESQQYISGVVSLDYIDVFGAQELAARGATLPYVEFEAEDGITNGLKIGPNRTYYSLPSEASGRMAVQITQGQYVEFNLTAPSNGIVVRFSIPDSPSGSGLLGYLGVYLPNTNEYIANLTVTSKFSWVYGNYPFTKNPADGLAHHFYDETRGKFDSVLPTNTVVRVVAQSSLVYTIDLVDFYQIPAPYVAPATGYFSVTDFGGDPTGQNDSTLAFEQVIAAAAAKEQGVWIPEGIFSVTKNFTLASGQIVRGAGPWYSIVQATVPHGVGFYGYFAPHPSENIGLYDFAIFGDTNVRNDSILDYGVGGGLDGSSVIQNLWIEHTKCGMWFNGPFSGLHVVATVIRDTFADGINLHYSLSNIVVEQSMLRNVGDDALAMWSGPVADSNNIFMFNTIQAPAMANGVGIYGGTNNAATDNYIADTVYVGSGLMAGNRFNSVLLNGTTIFARNTLVRCGSTNFYFPESHSGAIWFWSEEGVQIAPTVVDSIEIIDPSFAGITFWVNATMNNMQLSNIQISGAPFAVEVHGWIGGGTGQAFFSNVTATDLSEGGIYNCDSDWKTIQDSSCHGWNDTHC